jgi:hypothetical protein
MARTRTKDEKQQRGAERNELGRFASSWPEEEEAQTRSDVRRLPDDEDRSRWTTQTLVELEGDGTRLDFQVTE